MKDEGIDKGSVHTFETSDKFTKGHFYGFRKMFWKYLNKLNVPFFDPCCPEASTAAAGGGVGALPPNDMASGVEGAISVTNYLTTINTDAGGAAYTLANGTVVNQQKKISMKTDGGGNAIITPANLAGGNQIGLTDAGEWVLLVWNGTEWVMVDNYGATLS